MIKGLHGEFMVPDIQTVENLNTPPHSREAEQSLLGGLLLDDQTWDAISEMIAARDFYFPEHQVIFDAMLTLRESNQPLDVLTISEQLKGLEQDETAGGIAYLSELAASASTASNVGAYAEIIRYKSVLRQLIRAAGEISESARHPNGRRSLG